MQRRRTVAASPLRSAPEAWEAISDLISRTLDASPSIAAADVEAALVAVAPAAIALIAGGHSDRTPFGLVAADLILSVETASGGAAFDIDEQMNVVPGAATATDWMVHLPRPDLIGNFIDEVADGVDHVTTADIPAPALKAASSVPMIDLSRLDPNARR